MDIQNIASGIQSSEQYKIRKQTETQQAEQIQEQQELSQLQQQTDEYDKANPVGEEVEGIYSLSHDDSGNLKVDYKQPAQKKSDTDNAQSSQDAKASGQAAKSEAGAAATSTASTDDDELEELKEQRDALKRQLNKETDEAAKAQLRTQLQSIETQIALKSANV